MDHLISLKRGSVVLKKYHKEWVISFEIERDNLKSLLGDTAIGIQHIGSTSIPGLAAKPIIDMLMAVHGKVALTHDKIFSVVHIFRFEQDKIIEEWEASQQVINDSPNENGIF